MSDLSAFCKAEDYDCTVLNTKVTQVSYEEDFYCWIRQMFHQGPLVLSLVVKNFCQDELLEIMQYKLCKKSEESDVDTEEHQIRYGKLILNSGYFFSCYSIKHMTFPLSILQFHTHVSNHD